jgi:hypothetical protein
VRDKARGRARGRARAHVGQLGSEDVIIRVGVEDLPCVLEALDVGGGREARVLVADGGELL